MQLYHAPFDLVLKIKDAKGIPRNFRYEILYNGQKLERWWRGEKIVFNPKDSTQADIVFENLSLLPGRRNDITFLYYRSESAPPVSYTFSPPRCEFRDSKKIATLRPFKAEGLSVENIEQIAQSGQVNPSLLAALVAQESGFNPYAISWAKAVGLTQITSLANKEILALRPQWQYDTSVESLSFLELKAAILAGRVTKDRDWRLERLKSLEGGALYLNLLEDYWERADARRALKVFGKNPPLTEILLASYNSGAYRVKKSIFRRRQDWLNAKELGEARKYVMNIKSYCHAFSQASL